MSPRIDTHVHVVGDIDRYAQDPARSYTARPAPLGELQKQAQACGVSRFVVVQPSFYNLDNTVLLEALDTLGEKGRGVAVVDPQRETAASLAYMHARGVRGVRVNLYSGAADHSTSEMLPVLSANAKLAASLGWHVEVIASLALLAAGKDAIAKSPAPVVIDHYGVHKGYVPESVEGEALLDLLRMPHVWIKLSAPYRSSDDPLETVPNALWLRAMLNVAPERCLWGSDWPYTPVHQKMPDNTIQKPYRALSYERLFDDFVAGVSDPDLLDRVLTKNPARLYGFDA